MITKDEIFKMVRVMQANFVSAYSKFEKEDIQLMVDSWYYCLRDKPKDVVMQAFWNAFKTYKQPLTLGHITEQIEKMQNATQETDLDLWQQLGNAIYQASVLYSKFDYTAIPVGETKTQGEMAREEFNELWENLNPLLKDYCSTPQGLLNLIDCELDFEKGRFLKAVPNLRQRQRIKTETPNEILKMCESGFVLKDIQNKQLNNAVENDSDGLD